MGTVHAARNALAAMGVLALVVAALTAQGASASTTAQGSRTVSSDESEELGQAAATLGAMELGADAGTGTGTDTGTDAGTPFTKPLYVEKDTDASRASARLRTEGNTTSAALIDEIASQSTAVWLGDWFTPTLLKSVIKRHVDAAKVQGASLVFVTYAIPNRDCGGYSSGGHTYEDYLDWNRTIATALAGTGAVILVEPDSLAMLSAAKCADTATRRLPLLRETVTILRAAGLAVYLDGGNSTWLPAADQAAWLNQAGIESATGFYTNVANYNTVTDERNYAGRISSRVGLKHYVIDVSRNGAGKTAGWCNAVGAALGDNPRATPNSGKLDALLWVKHAGASDGTCDGGPAAGAWYESYALDLVRNRHAVTR